MCLIVTLEQCYGIEPGLQCVYYNDDLREHRECTIEAVFPEYRITRIVDDLDGKQYTRTYVDLYKRTICLDRLQ